MWEVEKVRVAGGEINQHTVIELSGNICQETSARPFT